MELHIFNPEHDLILANNTKNYTPSTGILKMRRSFSYVPVFWASEGDIILTDDVATSISENNIHGIADADVIFCTLDDLHHYHFDSINPWGWDATLKHTLLRYGVDASLMPSDEQLNVIRNMSHRRNVLPLMQVLRDGMEDITCGDGVECISVDAIRDALSIWKGIVIKAPWSSSGINIIYVKDSLTDPLCARCNRLISKQGSIMVEPLYNKVRDFAMEFFSDGNGNVEYLGLSVFETLGTAYLNNIVVSEDDKLHILSEYISPTLLREIQARICSYMSVICSNRYRGPFGVDMMIVSVNGRNVIDPCVEINLRRTMGHVAIERWKYMNR